MTPREAERQAELLLRLEYMFRHPEETALEIRRTGNMFSFSVKILTGREPAEKCGYCYAVGEPLTPHDTGKDGVLPVCAACLRYFAEVGGEGAQH